MEVAQNLPRRKPGAGLYPLGGNNWISLDKNFFMCIGVSGLRGGGLTPYSLPMEFNADGQTTNCGKAEAHEPHVKRTGYFNFPSPVFHETGRVECDGVLWHPVT